MTFSTLWNSLFDLLAQQRVRLARKRAMKQVARLPGHIPDDLDLRAVAQ
ncbi:MULTISPECIES: hypothetical protein [Rhizobium]|nr:MULTISPECIES: hypothetical protein [Rhizobium]